MLKKGFLIVLILFSVKVFSQEISPLKSEDDLDELKTKYKNKVVLYNFWATWCKPCVEEFPELVKLYELYNEKGFEIVFVSVNEKDDVKEKVIPFLEKQNVKFATYYNDFKKIDDLMNYYDKKWDGAIPATFIYDKEGNLVSNFIGNKNFDFFEKEIQKYLN